MNTWNDIYEGKRGKMSVQQYLILCFQISGSVLNFCLWLSERKMRNIRYSTVVKSKIRRFTLTLLDEGRNILYMKKNTGFLKLAFLKRGLTVNEAAKSGFGYDGVWKHWRGDRAVSPEKAIEYERKLGIPRSELRPDLWPADSK